MAYFIFVKKWYKKIESANTKCWQESLIINKVNEYF